MKRTSRVLVLGTVVWVVSTVGTAPSAAAEAPQQRASAFLAELLRISGTPGLSAAVAREGEIVFCQGAGLADVEHEVPSGCHTVFNIGSVSKAMTAVAVMQLVEDGKVQLSDDVRRFVPSFPDKGAPITLRHLLTHISGIRSYRESDFPGTPDNENTRPFQSFEEAIGLFKKDALLFTPGSFYSYSSYAVNLLQGVVEGASGLPFEQALRRRIWHPAGMQATAFDVPSRIVKHRARGYAFEGDQLRNYPYNDLSYKYASGGMISTAEDLVRFGSALLQGKLMSSQTVRQMFAVQLDPVLRFEAKGEPVEQEFRQALMWRVRTDAGGHEVVHHCGTVKGFNACLLIYPEEKLVVSLLSNSERAPAFREAARVAELFRAPEAASRRLAPRCEKTEPPGKP